MRSQRVRHNLATEQQQQAYESVDSVDCPPQYKWASPNPLRDWSEEFALFPLPHYLSWGVSWSLALLLWLYLLLHWLIGLQTWSELYHWVSSVSSFKTEELLRFHNHVTQHLTLHIKWVLFLWRTLVHLTLVCNTLLAYLPYW